MRTIDLEGFAVDPRAAEWAEFREHYPRCPDCSREVARLGAVVTELASVRGSAHLADDQLLAFATSPERLGPEQRARVEEHLAGCAPCRTELAVLRGFDFAALGAAQWSATARLLEAVRRLGAAFVPPLPKLALAAAAVALIAVSVSIWRADFTGEAEVQIAALLPSEAPRYAPGALVSDAGRRIGGAARGTAAGAPAPQVLAPAHVGATSRESPTLYWFLPEATSLPVEVTVVDPGGAEPLLERTLPGPVVAGIHPLRLAEYGVQLAPGVEYQWFVSLVVDPARRPNDVVSGGSIRRETAPAELALASTERRAHAYAEAGLWYDAFDQLSAWLAAEPGAALLHAHRAALLEQVGLDEAARYERGTAPGAAE